MNTQTITGKGRYLVVISMTTGAVGLTRFPSHGAVNKYVEEWKSRQRAQNCLPDEQEDSIIALDRDNNFTPYAKLAVYDLLPPKQVSEGPSVEKRERKPRAKKATAE